ncbi:hypothetical protein QAD02_007561 [Eretmocerus hayati]|uniref:Uncharacterized protein n=1 Tax=Eretmocerus hayati TaxID=131215 RepID=A0ACC2N6E3_9HYME|nr:hypothetical protein QAD02_007561 [Eretmocerus hayati]
MSNYASHEDNRKKVCAPCGNKIIFGRKKISEFAITDRFEKCVKSKLEPNFSLTNSKFPVSICVTCRLTLSEHEKDIKRRPMPTMPNHGDIVLLKETRNSTNDIRICLCYICLKARSSDHQKPSKGRGHLRENISNTINGSNGLYGAGSNSIHTETTEISRLTPKVSTSICVQCRQEISRGKSHVCRRNPNKAMIKRVATRNLSIEIERLPEDSQLRIAHSILKRTANQSSDPRARKNLELNMNTFGRPKKILYNAEEKGNTQFSAMSLDNLQTNTGSSRRSMLKVTNFIRAHAGRNAIPPHYRDHMKDMSNVLENYYKTGEFYFDIVKGKPKEKRYVIYADASELTNAVIENRRVYGNYQTKVMADSGQGFFKVCATYLPEGYSESQDEYVPEKKRRLYASGGTVGQKSKLTSVNRLIMLCIVPNIAETYDNVKLLFQLTNINKISFKYVSDIKLLLTTNGLQTASATCPCPWCNITLQELRKPEIACDTQKAPIELRTSRDLSSALES